MSIRKRKVTDKKRPVFKVSKPEQETGNEDLKKVKEQIMKEIEANEANAKEWYDKELDKNLKKQ